MFKKSLLALAVCASTSAWADVDYHIDLTEPTHHTGQVDIVFPDVESSYIDVKMPAWRTGYYRILNLANGVRDFAATSEEGEPLNWEKVDKSTWRIHLPESAQGDDVKVNYQIYANQLGRRSRHIDDSHAYLDASAVFMYADAYRAEPVTVSLDVKDDWRSVSGMESEGAHTFVADNWDILVDSPIETGINELYKFTVDDRHYEVVFWGEGNYDAEQTVEDLEKLVQQSQNIWRGHPYERYVFMIHATSGAGGATEHRNSTIIQRPRYSYASRDDYLSFLSTASHELIHTWNVKAYRPEALVPYDYQKENYTDLFWLAEGSTSYFQNHLLMQADIMTTDEYFERVASGIERYYGKPGREIMSVAEASFEAWSDQYGDRAHNFSVNIYSEGAMVSWVLDLALIERTDGEVTYRDVHNALYQRFDADEEGFNSADVVAILDELTGQSWQQWWDEHVNSPVANIQFDELLNTVGMELTFASADEQKPWAGWRGKAADEGIELIQVERGSPAWDAGFTPGDVIVAYDGKRAAGGRFEEALQEREVGDTVEVTFFRRDQLHTAELILGEEQHTGAKIVPVENPSAKQKARFLQWLQIPHPNAS
ncbi:PDZ domain-containing protein [uncultured Idiomarina sp.]|uniref:M61 family metallopeptidase n=2 Tax=Idiomarina TaxID=135575 RepID=UPI000C8B3826|nr:peptidase M61 [Idiomarinaceae bacterium]